ncbi:MAG: REP element-mobilizing transposase RayT [Paraglaciecola sp.]|jgi:REP element-mobilizing transposase RayT
MWYGSRAIDEYSGTRYAVRGTSYAVRVTRYEHRRAWVEDKVLWLSSVFAIGICAYSVMSNHVHLVLCVDKDKAMSWSDKQVVGRWHRLHRGTLLSQKFMRNELLSESEQMMQAFKIHTHRKRIGGMRQAKRLIS